VLQKKTKKKKKKEEDFTALFNNYHPRYWSNEFENMYVTGAQIIKLKTAVNFTNL
jgi:hypothetical protein